MVNHAGQGIYLCQLWLYTLQHLPISQDVLLISVYNAGDEVYSFGTFLHISTTICLTEEQQTVQIQKTIFMQVYTMMKIY